MEIKESENCKTYEFFLSLFSSHCREKKLRYVQIHFGSSNSSFKVLNDILKLKIRGGQ